MSALLAKVGGPLVIFGAMILAAMFLGIMALNTVDRMVETARSTMKAERDAHWAAEIERSNSAANAQIARNLQQTMAAQDAARDQVAAAEQRARELEKENAALPDDGNGGLGRERVRLLNQR